MAFSSSSESGQKSSLQPLAQVASQLAPVFPIVHITGGFVVKDVVVEDVVLWNVVDVVVEDVVLWNVVVKDVVVEDVPTADVVVVVVDDARAVAK